MNTADNGGTVAQAALAVAGTLRHAVPGDLAAMRRMQLPTGAPLFWRLAARHAVIDRDPDAWIVIARILARLTPTGEPARRPDLHDKGQSLGAVLCDGGSDAWPTTNPPKPVLSEARLARLLAARGKTRRVTLERAMRMLPPGTALNIPEIAWTILNPDNTRIARDYYARLDRAARDTNHKEAEDA